MRFPHHIKHFMKETQRLMEKSTQFTANRFIKIWRLKCRHCTSLGNPSMMSHREWVTIRDGSGCRSGHGCPLYDWFHQGSPDGATSSANARINKVSIETFRCGKGWFDKERIKELLIWNVVSHFLEMAFINIRHKRQQLMIYITASVQCTHLHVGSDIIV